MKKSNILIDVLLPFYGDIELAKQSIESILNQINTNWRLIIVDDWGHDVSAAETYIKSLIKKYGKQKIVYHQNPRNLGANLTFQKAQKLAKAPYYVMMGADDIMKPNFLSRFVEFINQYGDIDIYQPDVEVINETGEVYRPLADRAKRLIRPKKSGIYSGESIARSLTRGSWHYFPSLIWKTSSAKKVGFKNDYDVVLDVCAVLDIIQNGGTFGFDKNHYTFNYRRHSASDSSRKAVSGYRFAEEQRFFNQKSKEFAGLAWHSAARTSKRHIMSRLNALATIPKAMSNPDGNWREVIKYVFK